MLNKSQQRFLTLCKHLFPLVQCDEIALKFAKNGANVLKIRNNLESCADDLVELEIMLQNEHSLPNIGVDTVENGHWKGKKTAPFQRHR